MNRPFGIVETVGRLDCSAEEAWKTVCFYEHVHTRPSWFLRTVLPVPQRTTGCYGQVGDESRCLYSDDGFLAKRITGLRQGESIEFDIIEQSIRYHRHVALRGGVIRVVGRPDGACSVHMITRYELRSALAGLLRRFVVATISSMHRFVMRDMYSRAGATCIEFAHDSRACAAPGARARGGDESIGAAAGTA